MSVLVGDCVELMAAMPEASVDAVVTDPPYGIRFMGQAWDGAAIEEAVRAPRNVAGLSRLTGGADDPNRKETARTGSAFATAAGAAGAYDFTVKGNRAFQQWTEAWAREAFRVLKPGGFLLCFAGTRTYHRMASGVEDAGFEIRDCIAWMYGSGFPKSLDVSKAIDARAGAERAITREQTRPLASGEVIGFDQRASSERERRDEPATAAAAWDGWGTALKPAFEPIVVARKPLTGTVAANVLKHGTGALNVDRCRIEGNMSGANFGGRQIAKPGLGGETMGSGWQEDYRTAEHEGGRWPANVVLDEEAAELLDAQTGELHSQDPATRNGGRKPGWSPAGTERPMLDKSNPNGGDSGGASRFFYCAKASTAERNAGLDGFASQIVKLPGKQTGYDPATGKLTDGYTGDRKNHHPTVKPIALMRWLVRLVTPPGGTILDPFAGSGTTAVAAVLEGFEFVACERDPDYARIAEARIEFWREHGDAALEYVRKREAEDPAQLSLLGDAA